MENGFVIGDFKEKVTSINAIDNHDQEMVRNIQAGNQEAWRCFFDRFSPWVYRFAYWHLNSNHADAEDLCSDIMLTAVNCIHQYNAKRGDLDSWVYGIARHRLSKYCRSKNRELPITPELQLSSDRASSHTNIIDNTHLNELVNRTLASLPERQSTALVEKYVNGCSTDEIAVSLGSTTKAAESLLGRARKRFQSVFNLLLTTGNGGENNG